MLVILYSMPILCSVYEAPYINFQGYNYKKKLFNIYTTQYLVKHKVTCYAVLAAAQACNFRINSKT